MAFYRDWGSIRDAVAVDPEVLMVAGAFLAPSATRQCLPPSAASAPRAWAHGVQSTWTRQRAG